MGPKEWELVIIGLLVFALMSIITAPFIFRNFKWYRYFACKIMKWHSIPYVTETYHDGASQHAKCKWCGYEGMMDSQGNLF